MSRPEDFVPTGGVPRGAYKYPQEPTKVPHDTSRPTERSNPNSGGLARPTGRDEGPAVQQLDRPGIGASDPRSGGDVKQLYVISSIYATPCFGQGKGRLLEMVVSYEVPEESLVEALAYIMDRSGAGK